MEPLKVANDNYGRPSRRLTLEDWLQSRIAAHFDVNSGRISEIKTGKRFPQAYQLAIELKDAA